MIEKEMISINISLFLFHSIFQKTTINHSAGEYRKTYSYASSSNRVDGERGRVDEERIDQSPKMKVHHRRNEKSRAEVKSQRRRDRFRKRSSSSGGGGGSLPILPKSELSFPKISKTVRLDIIDDRFN